MNVVATSRPRARHFFIVGAASLICIACSSQARARCTTVAPASSTVTARELRGARTPRLLEAIKRVRPRFVQTRAPRRDQFAVVYLDGVRIGDVNTLAEIPVADVVDVVFLSAPDATTRFGTDHTGGALLVRTQAGLEARRCLGS